MVNIFGWFLLAEERRQELNRHMQAWIRAAKKMTLSDLFKHRKHKHFAALVYFWVANDYREKGREEEEKK